MIAKIKCLLLVLLVMLSASGVFGQEGLLLSRYKGGDYHISKFRAEISNWYQLQDDKISYGGAAIFCPYFPTSNAEVRVKGGFYGTKNKLNAPEDITYYLLMPGSPTAEIGAGYTKLFPQRSSKSYYEIALNADVFYALNIFSIREIPFDNSKHDHIRIGTYHARAGIEVIPIPWKVSVYANANFLLGVSGKKSFQDSLSHLPLVIPPLLEKAEYLDAGIRSVIGPGKKRRNNRKCSARLIIDMNLIFAESRISRLIPSRNSVIPTLKTSFVISIPKKK